MTDFDAIDKSDSNNGSSIALSKDDKCKSRRFVMTINNYSEADFSTLKKLCKDTIYYAWGKEIAPTTGTPHLQCYVEFKNDRYRKAILKLFNRGFYIKPAKCKKENNAIYCCKTDLEKSTNIPIPVDIEVITELRPFQKSLDIILDGPVNEKKIIWVYDPIGQLGKTEFLKYLFKKHNCPFSYGEKCSDIINLIFNNKKYYLNTNKGIAIFNFGREMDMKHVSVKALEQISDGAISNTKFETGCFIMNCPHVLILANSLPITSTMTKGRFIIKTISESNELIDYIEPISDLDK
jgi:hypothetical protein